MKILWDSGNIGFGGCGINEWDRNVVTHLRKRGHEVTIIVDNSFKRRPRFKKWSPPEGGYTKYDGFITPNNYGEAVSSLGGFDVQIGNHFTMFPMVDSIVPVVHDYHIPGRDSYNIGIFKTFEFYKNKAKGFICTTPFIEDQLLGEYPNLETQVVYGGSKLVYNGKWERERPYISYWGNRYACGTKNFLSLLKTLPYHSLDMVICGFMPPSDKEIQLVKDMGCEGRVSFYTGLDDLELSKMVAGSSLYVCPSTYEGFGLPVVEAMSLGVPVVVSPCASLPSIVGDGGLVAKSHRTKDLSQSINQVVNNPEDTEARRLRGLERSKMWKWGITAEKIEKFVEGLL